jgi:multicomponent Na+:H+ antiporter subunit E
MMQGLLSRYLATSVALFCSWLLFTSTTSLQEVLAGALLGLLIAALVYRGFTCRGLRMLSPRRLAGLFVYLPVFFWEMIKANFDVAYRVIHPRMPIRPGIVAIKTDLTTDIGKLFLANSITLTPGTLTMEICEDYLFIHWINVKAEDVRGASELISGRFEKYLKAICE